MRVLKVWDGEYPWDVRAEKVCRALTKAGHEVHMVARNRDVRTLREELDECTVHRMPPFRLFGARLDAASQFPAFFNPRWIRLMKRIGRAEEAEVVLVRDLPLAPTAIYIGRSLGIPVILDMAENYPAMIRDLWTTGSTKPGDFIVRNPKAVEAVERWTLERIDHVLVVVEESRDRLVEVLGATPERITVVGNTPSSERLSFEGGDGGLRTHTDGSEAPVFRLTYLGLLEHARGVGAVIEAVGICRSRGVPVEFTIIGDGRAAPDFKRKTRELGLDENAVRMLGFVPYEEALEIVAAADAGVIPHLANESWNTTIPNKLFDYMAAGIAVLTSEARPAKRVVDSTGCGLSFLGGDASSAAAAIESMWRSGLLREFGRRGREAVRTHFNWEKDGGRLVRAVEGVVRRAGATVVTPGRLADDEPTGSVGIR